ncbi:MAG TPA: FHA domain-containing protein [Thermoanaerobaculia bacterium]|jgi:adenylate cyclase|nr:FHA domain-containing protein [Thermoanaerobaculia bacterium]
MSAFQLVPATDGGQTIELAAGARRVVGRSPTSDLPIYDVTISREHAELAPLADGLRVRDLGSTNGTFVNGTRVRDHVASDGDTVTFGSVAFRLQRAAVASVPAAGEAQVELITARHQVNTIREKLPVTALSSPALAEEAPAARDGGNSGLLSLVRTIVEEGVARRMEALLEVAIELGRHPDLDSLLQRIVDLSFSALQVDRAAVLVVEGDALELTPRAGRVRRGRPEEAGQIPRAIAYEVLTERVAVLSDNVSQDERFDSDSARHLAQHSALCIPLVGEQQTVLGLLYLENADRLRPFGVEDLEFMTAFGGLAALALEHQQLQHQLREERDTMQRLQRYLSPSLAAEAVLRQGEVSLVRPARRQAVLLHCALHDFGAAADALPEADLAELLGAYLSRVGGTILEYGGTVANVCGHTVLALWGAPVAGPGDADRALRAALGARRAVGELQRQWARRGVARCDLAVGIAQGAVFVGDVASGQRVEYALAGSLLDAATRLCEEAGPGGILVGETFYRALSNQPSARAQRLRGVTGDVWRLGTHD